MPKVVSLNGVRSEVYLGPMRTAVITGWDPSTPSHPPHLGSYTRALLVSQDRRHLLVTPCLKLTTTLRGWVGEIKIIQTVIKRWRYQPSRSVFQANLIGRPVPLKYDFQNIFLWRDKPIVELAMGWRGEAGTCIIGRIVEAKKTKKADSLLDDDTNNRWCYLKIIKIMWIHVTCSIIQHCLCT